MIMRDRTQESRLWRVSFALERNALETSAVLRCYASITSAFEFIRVSLDWRITIFCAVPTCVQFLQSDVRDALTPALTGCSENAVLLELWRNFLTHGTICWHRERREAWKSLSEIVQPFLEGEQRTSRIFGS